MTKKGYERRIAELTEENERLKGVINEKDKEIKVQALKLRELIHDEFRKDTIKKNYNELERLTQSPKSVSTLGRDRQDSIQLLKKLDERKSVMVKYGKLPLKPGFNKRKLDYHDKMAMLEIQTYGGINVDKSSRAISQARSRSVDPTAKTRHMG